MHVGTPIHIGAGAGVGVATDGFPVTVDWERAIGKGVAVPQCHEVEPRTKARDVVRLFFRAFERDRSASLHEQLARVGVLFGT